MTVAHHRLRAPLLGMAAVLATHCGGGPAAPTAPTTVPAVTSLRVSAELPVVLPSAGLYQDGLGVYPPGDDVFLSPDQRSLFIRPLCAGSGSTPRRLTIILPPDAREIAAGRLSTCMDLAGNSRAEGVILHLPSPLAAAAGVIVGGGAPPNADTSGSVFLLFNVDSNGDGTIRVPPDDQYNVRWQRGLQVQERTDTAAATVYRFTSEATAFGPDRSCDAELILRSTPLGEIGKGRICLPLTVTLSVHK